MKTFESTVYILEYLFFLVHWKYPTDKSLFFDRQMRCFVIAGWDFSPLWVLERTSTRLPLLWQKVQETSTATCSGVSPMQLASPRQFKLPAWWVTWHQRHSLSLSDFLTQVSVFLTQPFDSLSHICYHLWPMPYKSLLMILFLDSRF